MEIGWPLTGRSRELELIAEAISPDGAVAGAVVGGDAGVGKTRLMREALERSNHPSRWVSASMSAQAIPLGALAPWVPRGSDNQISLAQDVIALLVGSEPELVIAIDDAHLLDELSVFVVQQIAVRRLARVILTVRNGEAIQDTITSLWTDGHLRRFDIDPLTRPDSASLVEAALGGPLDPSTSQQLWRLTKGNALYLRHIVEHETAAGRLAMHGGLWSWTGELVVSPSLNEMIVRHMGTLPEDVATVVDLLAVGEPLSLRVLSQLVDSSTLERAETRRLTTVESTSGETGARLAHPMYGEARKATAGPLRLRRLRGLVASALARETDSDVRTLLRRAVLTLDSDLDADPADMLRASEIALSLADAPLALRLSHAAVVRGGGWPAEFAHATNLMNIGRVDEAAALLAAVAASDAPEPVRLQADFLRTWAFHAAGKLADAEAALSQVAESYSGPQASAAVATLTAVAAASRADVTVALAAADTALSSPALPDLARMMAMVAKVISLSEQGRLSDMRKLHEEAYALARSSGSASMPLITFAEFYTWGLRMAGCLTEARRVVDAIRDAADGPTGLHWSKCMTGGADLSAGRAQSAVRQFESVIAGADALGWAYRYGIEHAAAYAIAGQVERAVEVLDNLESMRHGTFGYMEPQLALASAWTRAAQGWISGAVSEARRAADDASAHGQISQEVSCLQYAAQFGDARGALRLAELAATVDTPRAAAAAAHAAALASHDGAALDAASRAYEDFGDLLAAADAAAQAAEMHRQAGERNAERASTVRARTLAESCGGVRTPAMTKVAAPPTLTAREREIITMAAEGLSNREIAGRLSVSVRTVEGHLYRASVRTNTRSRAELTALLRQR
ncbi:LuxR C-terminal-related transcriptional regulator [Mycolicibacterium sp. BiH015]|uniref:helix-turn-helix transcriptional regulator n=1 Tax=Mycolicibacterium sp. BiH015 TaxID=3018808 RepID=UPI0022DF888E|nr:LuxR family transcriptional regulator [Mycolicibacterium sp. BiH015]MDA2890290.1 LuxR C-terminal-related transcriptional regulator [Mycolicibacterium sp. BiH015]